MSYSALSEEQKSDLSAGLSRLMISTLDILDAIGADVNTPESVAEVTGLSRRTVEQTLLALWDSDFPTLKVSDVAPPNARYKDRRYYAIDRVTEEN